MIELYKQVKAENMNIPHVIRLLSVANNDIPSVENRLQELQREEDDLKFRNERAARTAQEINNQILSERQTLEHFRVFVKQQQQKVERLYSEKKGLEDIMEWFQNNDETYTKIIEMAKEQIESAMASSPRQLLKLALASMVASSRKNPSMFQAMHYNMPSTRVIVAQRSFLQSGDILEEQHPNLYVSNDEGACEKLLLDRAELIYNQMLEEFANTCINKIANDTKSPKPSSLQPPKEPSDQQYDQSYDEGKQTDPHTSGNVLITTNAVCDEKRKMTY